MSHYILKIAMRYVVTAMILVTESTGMIAAAQSESDSTSIDITYVANEGFLIAVGSTRVLIDALFTEGFGTYLTPSRAEHGRLRSASPPFDGVDLILVTHRHDDHFSPAMTLAHLKNNPEAVLIAPQQVVEILEQQKEFESVTEQVNELTPAHGEVAEATNGAIELKVFGMNHAPYMENGVNRHRDIQNLGYLVTVGGINVFHVGDAVFDLDDAFIDSTEIDAEWIDVLFIKSYDLSENTQHLVNEVFQPELVIGMHTPPKEMEKMRRVFTSVFPNGFVFKDSMEKKTVTILWEEEPRN